jgi:DNA-binding transcriptional ArsR family regulator
MGQPVKPLSGRPLFATAADAEFYVSLPDVERRLERSVDRQLNTLILGDRGSGKTTLVQHLLFRRREQQQGPPVVYIDGSVARSVMDAVELLRDQLGVAGQLGETFTQNLQSALKPTTPGVRDSRLILARLRPLRDVEAAVVIFDGLVDADVVHGLFGRLRDELWALPFTWVVTADTSQRSQVLTPPADAFFETIIELRGLTDDEQRELLRRRLPEDWRKVSPLIGAERDNPRRLLTVAREAVVDERPIEDLLHAAGARAQRAAQIGRAASTMLAELENLDRPVAGSDEELLQRLGVTRERASQVLKQLEQHGLVESFSEPAERGRPRKLYRVRDVGDDHGSYPVER